MFKSAVFRIEMEFWRQRLGRYPILALCTIPLAVLGILTCGFFSGHSAYDGYDIYGGEASVAASADQGSLIRWHFYAASDSEEDQFLKIAVKEAVMAEAEELFAEAKTMDDCRRILAANLPRLYETACRVLAGTDSPDQGNANPQQVQVYYEPRYFSARQLTEGQLSAGVYETVAFVLGEGQGGNWWCLLYPPLSPGQKVVFTPVPQSRITQRAQQKYDGKHDLNPGAEPDQQSSRESGQEQNRESDKEQAKVSEPKTNGEAVREARESGNGSDRQSSAERLPVQCKLKIWEILRREN